MDIRDSFNTLPGHKPLFYYHLAEAAYAKSNEKYLKKNAPNVEFLEERKIDGWKFILIKNKESGERSIAFRGSDNVKNWMDGIFSHFFVAKNLYGKMGKTLSEWRKKHGKIDVFTGHSAGGRLATEIDKASKAFRITFNGDKSNRGLRHINLRTASDPVTRLPGNSLKVQATVGKGGHSLVNFEKHLQGKSWLDLGIGAKDHNKDLVNQAEEILEQVGISIDNVMANKEVPELAKKANNLTQSLEKQWKINPSYVANVLYFAEQIAIDLYRDSYTGIKEQWAAIDKASDYQKELFRGAERLNYPQLQQMAFSRLHPGLHLRLCIADIEKDSKAYTSVIAKIRERLGANRETSSLLKTQNSNLDGLDQATRELYRELRSRRQRLIGNLGNLSTFLGATSTLLCLVAPEAEIAIAALSLGSTATGIGRQKQGSKLQGLSHSYSSAHADLQHARQILATIAQVNGASTQQLINQRTELYSLLMQSNPPLDPETHRKTLADAVKNTSRELDESRKLAATYRSQLLQTQQQIAALKKAARIALLKGKDKRYNKILRKIAIAEARALNFKNELKMLGNSIDDQQDNLAIYKKNHALQMRFAPLKDQIWSTLKQEEAKWRSDDETIQKLRDDADVNLKRYNEMRQIEREMVLSGINALKGLALELNHMIDLYPAQLSLELAQRFYQLYDLQRYWSDFALPHLSFTCKELSDGNILGALEKLGPKFVILNLVVPGLQLATVGLSCVRLAKQLWSNSDRPLTREESYLQALAQHLHAFEESLSDKLQVVHSCLDKKQNILQEELTFIREELAVVTKETIQEIRKGTRQVISEIHNSNRHATMIEMDVELRKWHGKWDLSSTLDQLDNPYLSGYTRACISEGGKIQSIVPHNLVRANPIHFSSLLALYLGHKEAVPNIFILHKPLVKLVEKPSTVTPQQINAINDATNRAIAFAAASEKLLRTSWMKQYKILTYLRQRQDQIEATTRNLTQAQLASAKKYLEKSRKLPLTGASRFSLSYQVYANTFGKLLRNHPLKPRLEEQQSWSQTMVNLSSDAVSIGTLGTIGTLALGPTLFGILPLVVTQGVILYRQHNRESFNQNTLRVAKWIDESITKQVPWVGTGTPHGYSREREVNYTHLDIECHLDSKTGEIAMKISLRLFYKGKFWGAVDLSPEESLSTLSNKTKRLYLIHWTFDSYPHYRQEKSDLLRGSDLDRVREAPYSPAIEDYDSAARKLYQDYHDLVLSHIKKEEVKEECCVRDVKEKGQLVMSSCPSLVPLFLPKSLMKALDNELKGDRLALATSQTGTLIPMYNLCWSESEKRYNLQINFHLNTKEIYKKVVIASFDRLTVESFGKNPNEFLIQALYSGFGGKLGLCSMGSRRLGLKDDSPLWAFEDPFDGLFKLLEEKPECALHYDSSVYSRYGGLKNLICIRSPAHAAEHFCSIQRKIRKNGEKLQTSLDALNNIFDAILGHCQLVSAVDNQTLCYFLHHQVGLVAPKSEEDLAFEISRQPTDGLNHEGLSKLQEILTAVPHPIWKEMVENLEILQDK